jgi:hypothetical protein|tara:strand:+ start:1298 stop:2215 length:918 start_codon:yes stop_codon:yes gene_type:complete
MKHAQSRFGFILLALAAVFLGGCRSVFQNYVESQVPKNASNIYTFTFRADLSLAAIVDDSEQAWLWINGEKIRMDLIDEGALVFSIDYPIPLGQEDIRYYYELTYTYHNGPFINEKVRYSTYENYGRPYSATLTSRYPIQLVSARGRVGDRIAVVGSGFSEMDTVTLEGMPAETFYSSPFALEFIVPAASAGRSYGAIIETATGDLALGSFRIDEGRLNVTPASLNLASGEPTQLSFMIEGQAPMGGLLISVTTDVPTSVIMPEVVIPAGSNSVSVIVEGGVAGSGSLFAEVPGFGQLVVPITVY